VDAVSWDTRIDGDLVCAQAKYHARSSKTFVLSLLRLSLLPLIALCCWIVANRSFRMRLKKQCVAALVKSKPTFHVAHNLRHIGDCFCVHACAFQSNASCSST
jgi:hypothetical protein